MTAPPEPWQLYPMPDEQTDAIRAYIAGQVRTAVEQTLRDAYEAVLGDSEHPVRGLIYLAEHLGVDLEGIR